MVRGVREGVLERQGRTLRVRDWDALMAVWGTR